MTSVHPKNGTTGVRLAILHCHSSLRCGCCASWPVILCITPRLWKMTRSPSVHRCAYTVEGEYARRCKLRQILLTSARSEVVLTSPVTGCLVCRACTQQPAICRLGERVSRVRQTICKVVSKRLPLSADSIVAYWEGVDFLSLEGREGALCFLAADACYA
jgi:hypothetical protein